MPQEESAENTGAAVDTTDVAVDQTADVEQTQSALKRKRSRSPTPPKTTRMSLPSASLSFVPLYLGPRRRRSTFVFVERQLLTESQHLYESRPRRVKKPTTPHLFLTSLSLKMNPARHHYRRSQRHRTTGFGRETSTDATTLSTPGRASANGRILASHKQTRWPRHCTTPTTIQHLRRRKPVVPTTKAIYLRSTVLGIQTPTTPTKQRPTRDRQQVPVQR